MNEVSFFHDFTEVNILLLKALSNRYKNLNLNVTPLQSRIIMFIYDKEGEVYQRDLSEFIGCNKSTLSSVLSTMEKNGFIERRSIIGDSRKNYIHLTKSALEIVNLLKKDHQEIDKTLEDGISQEEIETFRAFLKKVKNNLERI